MWLRLFALGPCTGHDFVAEQGLELTDGPDTGHTRVTLPQGITEVGIRWY